MPVSGSCPGCGKGKKTFILSGEIFRIEESRENQVKTRLSIAEKLFQTCKTFLKDAQIIRVCEVSRSSYEERKKAKKDEDERQAKQKAEDDSLKDKMIQIIHRLGGEIPGYRTFSVFLWRLFDVKAGHKKIARLMKEMNLKAATRKKDAYKGAAKHDHPCTAPDNLVNQNFKVKPRHIICTDITYLPYGISNGLLYLCIFKDAFTKEILGWASGTRMTVSLIQKAYDRMMADHGSELKTKEVLVHSDQGSQYLSSTFKKLLSDDSLLQSVSARANSQDNAPAESFFGLMKPHMLEVLKLCRNTEEAVEMVDGYIHTYNNDRYQYELAGLTPHEFYLFKESGIYPCDNYYGVKADSLHSIEDIVNHSMAEKARKAEKMRAIYSQRSRAAQLLKKNPIDVVENDQVILHERIHSDIQHIANVQEEVDRLMNTLNKAKMAEKWMKTLDMEKLNYYRTPQHWQNEPHLQYIWGMTGLF